MVADLGGAPLSGVTVSSEGRVLPAGRYEVQSLLGGARGAPLRLGGNGRIDGYVPLRSLGPLDIRVFDLARGGR